MPIINNHGFISKNAGGGDRNHFVLVLTMQVSYALYFLEFRHPFRLSSGVRSGTESVFVKISKNGFSGYGEATLPPYLDEKPQTVIDFLTKWHRSIPDLNASPEENIERIQQLMPGNYAAKCAVESAYLHWYCQSKNTSLSELFNLKGENSPLCTYTLGVSEGNEIKTKLTEGKNFPVIKIKLDGKNDKKIISEVRVLTPKPLCVDVNQGWKDLSYAIEISEWLKEMNVLMIEQPFAKSEIELHAKFTEKSALPVIADESVQTLEDLLKYGDAFSGVNIKLLKCGGFSQAVLMAEWLKMKKKKKLILIGCMSESSCGVYHASALEGYADILDLDGPYLIKNDPFSGFEIIDGKCQRSLLTERNYLNFTTF